MDFTILVNKNHRLAADFIPTALVNTNSRGVAGEKAVYGKEKAPIYLVGKVFEQFKAMQAAALELGYDIEIDSGYRSYEYQAKLYDDYLKEFGVVANQFSALPGTSEHQTGLALDLCVFRNGKYIDTDINEEKPEIKWVHQNAHRYGFIIRYPLAKSGNKDDVNEITGYKYEPWHLRYVGLELAEFLINNNLTLDEYWIKPKPF